MYIAQPNTGMKQHR